MTHLWKDEPRASLVDALFRGHREATQRQNISTEILKVAYMGSGDFLKSVVAAISSLGGTHAPILQAYSVLRSALPWKGLMDGEKIPGWGNSFVKGKPDPIWEETQKYISHYWHNVGDRIDWMTNNIHKEGKIVYPNAACYTAATAIILGLPKDLSPWLVIQARLPVWAQIIHDSTRQSPTKNLRDNRA
jgi:citrate synthase